MGGDDAFGRKVVALRALLLRWLRRYDVASEDREDVAHDVLVQLVDRAPALAHLSANELRSYAYVAATHVVLDRWRSAKRRATRDYAWFVCQPRVRQEHIAELLHALAVVRALPEPLRPVLVLCDVYGLSPGDVAEWVVAPLGTVKTRLRKARALCRTAADDVEIVPASAARAGCKGSS